ncbi:MAG: hypothetical protein LC104_13880 [Bacteroidales bacterium]|nr:hypothetical protein [Bacteroidales bacterium]
MSRWTRHAILWVGVLLGVFCIALPAPAFVNVIRIGHRHEVTRLNRKLAGRVLDFTRNHGCDRRIWSSALCEKRDAYVYLPPGYDQTTPFPMMIWLHGIGQDEKNFLYLVEKIDAAIRGGCFPPMVIVAPDGSIDGQPCLWNSGSFFVNSKAGRFGDWVTEDVYPFLLQSFCIRPEREAHVIAGGSMGGSGAYVIGFQHREKFGQIVGVMPGLNARYLDCRGRYRANYDPHCVSWRTEFSGRRVLGRFKGVFPVRERWLIRPLFDRGEDPFPFIMAHNPIEMLDSHGIRPGEFGLFVGYGTKDELNLDAQAEQFADACRERGIAITLAVVPGGRHSTDSTGIPLLPSIGRWLTQQLQPYEPPTPSVTAPVGAGGYLPLAAVRRAGLFPSASLLGTLP